MSHINPNFKELKPYLELIMQQGSKTLRPPRCTSCGKGHVWCHGSYQRKVKEGMQGPGFSNPTYVTIFRYFCNACKHTFSVLPEFISPRKWYIWAVQQAALLLVISGHSKNDTARQLNLGTSTCQRWIKNLKDKFLLHAFHLCSRVPELGTSRDSFLTFWDACLKQMAFAKAMYFIHHANRTIP